MRDFYADRVEVIDPIFFHHFHDSGVSDLHTGRFRVHFVQLRPDARWRDKVVEWLTENCSICEVEDFTADEREVWLKDHGMRHDTSKSFDLHAVLFTLESDATLAYLRFR